MIKRAKKKCISFSYEGNKKYKEIQRWEPKPYNIHTRNMFTFFKRKYKPLEKHTKIYDGFCLITNFKFKIGCIF